MNNLNQVDSVIYKLAVERLMQEISEHALTTMYLAERYKFLFDNDIEKSLNVIYEAFQPINGKCLTEDNKLHCEPEFFLNQINPEIKNMMFENLMKRLTKEMELDDVKTLKAETVEGDPIENSNSHS